MEISKVVFFELPLTSHSSALWSFPVNSNGSRCIFFLACLEMVQDYIFNKSSLKYLRFWETLSWSRLLWECRLARLKCHHCPVLHPDFLATFISIIGQKSKISFVFEKSWSAFLRAEPQSGVAEHSISIPSWDRRNSEALWWHIYSEIKVSPSLPCRDFSVLPQDTGGASGGHSWTALTWVTALCAFP